jgi:hypothetical protein
MASRKTNLTLKTGASVRDGGKDRNVILEWSPALDDLVTVRLSGTRRRYPVPVARIYRWIVAATVEAELREKKKARKRS